MARGRRSPPRRAPLAEGGAGRRAATRQRLTRTVFARLPVHRRDPRSRSDHPHLAANSGCRISCCGRRPMPSWCSWTCCGRISARRILPRRWPSMRGGSGGLAHHGSRLARLAGVCGARAICGCRAGAAGAGRACGSAGWPSRCLVDAATVRLVIEWLRLCRPPDARWLLAGGTLWILLAAAGAALAAGRPRDRPRQPAVPGAGGLGQRHRRLPGRAPDRRAAAGAAISPGKTWSGAAGGLPRRSLSAGRRHGGAGGLATSEGLVRAAAVALVLGVVGAARRSAGKLDRSGTSG